MIPSWCEGLEADNERLRRENADLSLRLSQREALIYAMSLRLEQMREAILWANGERDDFPARKDGQGPYWWRKELMRRSALSTPPGELAREMREVLTEASGCGCTEGVAEHAKALLAKMGGEG
jgi:hypothetical protein